MPAPGCVDVHTTFPLESLTVTGSMHVLLWSRHADDPALRAVIVNVTAWPDVYTLRSDLMVTCMSVA
jgi:hypothetical protein